jgi:hypothetical protein
MLEWICLKRCRWDPLANTGTGAGGMGIVGVPFRFGGQSDWSTDVATKILVGVGKMKWAKQGE